MNYRCRIGPDISAEVAYAQGKRAGLDEGNRERFELKQRLAKITGICTPCWHIECPRLTGLKQP